MVLENKKVACMSISRSTSSNTTRPSNSDPHHCNNCINRERPLSDDAIKLLYVKKITPSFMPTAFESSLE